MNSLREAAANANITGLRGIGLIPDESEMAQRVLEALMKFLMSEGVGLTAYSPTPQSSVVTVLIGDHRFR